MMPRSRPTTKRRRLSDNDDRDGKGEAELDGQLKEIIQLKDRKRMTRRLIPTTPSPRPGLNEDNSRQSKAERNGRFKHEQPAPEEIMDRNMAQYIENRLSQTTATSSTPRGESGGSKDPDKKDGQNDPMEPDGGQEVAAGKLHEYDITLLEKGKARSGSGHASKEDVKAQDSNKEQRERLVEQVLKESSITTSYLSPAFDRDDVQDTSALEQQLKEQEIQRLHWNIEQNLRRRAGAAARARRGGGARGGRAGGGGPHKRRGTSYGVR